jgi:hypothetical protein
MQPTTSPAPSAFKGSIGVSQQDITPPVGIFARNWGAATHDIAEGIHRPLFLTCIAFQSAPSSLPLVLIGADLGWWKNAAYEQQFRSQILEATQLPSSHLMFCLGHTHAGPGLCLDDAHKPGGNKIGPYLEMLTRLTVTAIERAREGVQPATLTWQYGKCDLAVNREFPDPNADRILTGYHPGEPADTTLLVGRIIADSGKVLATVVNYACHPTTLAWQNTLISPDYLGAMREIVEQGAKAPCLFLQGASGELSPPQQFTGDTALADRYGRQLGYAVLSTLESMEAPGQRLVYRHVVESGASLAMWEPEEVTTSTRLSATMHSIVFPIKDFPKYADLEAEWRNSSDPVYKERLWRKMCIRKAIGDGSTTEIPLWVWQLGNSLLIGQPNEAYSVFQTEIRARHPERAVAVMNLTNGSYGYLPPADRYALNTYPVWQTPFATGSFELLRQKTEEAIDQLLKSEWK